MAVAAFKSASRRATSSTPPQPPPTAAAAASPSSSGGGSGAKAAAQPTMRRSGGGEVAKRAGAVVPPRRSRSVSAFSRTTTHLDFANKRDNPLYWSAEVDSPRLEVSGVKVAKFDGGGGGGGCGGGGVENRRGRPVTRFSDGVGGKPSSAGGGGNGRGVGRSLSRVDTGRRRQRSVSRGHYGNSESERDKGSSSLRSRSKAVSKAGRVEVEDKSGIERSDSDLSELLTAWQTWSTQNPAFETGDASAVNQWEDGGSMSSFSDAEDGIGKPVSELAKVMRRSSSSSTLSTDIADNPLELVNAVEAGMVLEVRGEYARKLEESQERARKLRAELAVEEHREVELNQIIGEMIKLPETPEVKKPRAIRKASMERRRMSKRLEHEALAYFDECISISTFDDSDFSSLEDPLSNILGSAEQHGNKVKLPDGSASGSMKPCLVQTSDIKPMLPKTTTSQSTSTSTHLESPSTSTLSSSKSSWKRQFSFTDKQKGGSGSALKQELRSYAKIFAKDGGEKEIGSSSRTLNRHRHDTDEYVFSVSTEKFLFDRATFKNRIDSGGMVLCGGAYGLHFSPFSSVI